MAEQKLQTISWQAAEFRHYPKNAAWYVTLIAVSILVIAFFVIIENDIFAAACLAIITVLIIVFSKQTPGQVDMELSSRGVRFGNLQYPYKQIKYFWVVHNEHHKSLNFHTSALINNVVVLELENQDPEEVRQYMLRYVPEHTETQETFGQRVMHIFKF